jgi:septum formation topological specificity factor MinE
VNHIEHRIADLQVLLTRRRRARQLEPARVELLSVVERFVELRESSAVTLAGDTGPR